MISALSSGIVQRSIDTSEGSGRKSGRISRLARSVSRVFHRTSKQNKLNEIKRNSFRVPKDYFPAKKESLYYGESYVENTLKQRTEEEYYELPNAADVTIVINGKDEETYGSDRGLYEHPSDSYGYTVVPNVVRTGIDSDTEELSGLPLYDYASPGKVFRAVVDSSTEGLYESSAHIYEYEHLLGAAIDDSDEGLYEIPVAFHEYEYSDAVDVLGFRSREVSSPDSGIDSPSPALDLE